MCLTVEAVARSCVVLASRRTLCIRKRLFRLKKVGHVVCSFSFWWYQITRLLYCVECPRSARLCATVSSYKITPGSFSIFSVCLPQIKLKIYFTIFSMSQPKKITNFIQFSPLYKIEELPKSHSFKYIIFINFTFVYLKLSLQFSCTR